MIRKDYLNTIFFIIGLLFAITGIIINEWIIAFLFVEDGKIDKLSYRIIIWIFDGFCVCLGLLLILSKSFRSFISNYFDTNKQLFYNIGLASISIIISVAMLELLSGLLWDKLPERYNNGKGQVEIYLENNPSIQNSINSHPYLLYNLSKNFQDKGYLQHNSLGYRGAEFQFNKPESITRILAIGGSTTYMYPYIIDPEKTWVSQLEHKLNLNFNKNIEVINGGLPYATTAELLSAYVFRNKYLNPDILIIHTGGNDIAPLLFDNYDPEYTHFRSHGSGIIPRPFETTILKSKFFRVVYAVWLNGNETVYGSQPHNFGLIDRNEAVKMINENDSEGFARNLETLVKIAKHDGIKVVLFGFIQARKSNLSRNRGDLLGLEDAFIAGLEKHYQIMDHISKKYEIPFIIPDQEMFDDSWFIDNCHLNEEGEKKKAFILYQHLKDFQHYYFKG